MKMRLHPLLMKWCKLHQLIAGVIVAVIIIGRIAFYSSLGAAVHQIWTNQFQQHRSNQ